MSSPRGRIAFVDYREKPGKGGSTAWMALEIAARQLLIEAQIVTNRFAFWRNEANCYTMPKLG